MLLSVLPKTSPLHSCNQIALSFKIDGSIPIKLEKLVGILRFRDPARAARTERLIGAVAGAECIDRSASIAESEGSAGWFAFDEALEAT